MIKVKTGDAKGFSVLDKKKSKKSRIKAVREDRQYNIRLELVNSTGVGPGSMIVMEIQPPHTSSPVHNHCDTVGVMKVIANQIVLENYEGINLLPNCDKPYQR